MEKRILFCAFAEVPGPHAVGTRTAQLSSIFPDEGFFVDGLTLKLSSVAHIERLGTARMMRVPMDLDATWVDQFSKYSRAIGRQLASERYDLVVATDMVAAAAVLDHKAYEGKLLVDGDTSLGDAVGRAGGTAEDVMAIGGEFRESEVRKKMSALLVASRAQARELSAKVDPRNIHIVPRGVSMRLFKPSEKRGDRVVIFGTRDADETRRSLAIARALKTTRPRTRVQIVGAAAPTAGESASGIDNVVPDVDHLVVTTPKEVKRALRGARVVVLSMSETATALPHRALEAMAIGRVVVLAAPEAAYQGALVAGEDALCCAPNDVSLVVDAVEKIFDAPAHQQAMRDRAIKRVSTEYDIERVAEAFAEVVSKLLRTTVIATTHALTADGYTESRTGVEPSAVRPPSDDPSKPHTPAPAEHVSGPALASAEHVLPSDPERPPPLPRKPAAEQVSVQNLPTPVIAAIADAAETTVAAMDLGSLPGMTEAGGGDIWAETEVDSKAPMRDDELPPGPPSAVFPELTPAMGNAVDARAETVRPAPTSSAPPWPAVLGAQAREALSDANRPGDDDWAPDTVFDQSPMFSDDAPGRSDAGAASNASMTGPNESVRKPMLPPDASTESGAMVASTPGNVADNPFRVATARFLVEDSAEGGATAEQSRLPPSSEP